MIVQQPILCISKLWKFNYKHAFELTVPIYIYTPYTEKRVNLRCNLSLYRKTFGKDDAQSNHCRTVITQISIIGIVRRVCISGDRALSIRHGQFSMINAESYSMNSNCIPMGLRSLTKWPVLLQCWESIMLTVSNESTSGKQSCTLGDFIHLHIDDIRTVFAMQKRNTAKIMRLEFTYKNIFDLLLMPLYLTHTHTHKHIKPHRIEQCFWSLKSSSISR